MTTSLQYFPICHSYLSTYRTLYNIGQMQLWQNHSVNKNNSFINSSMALQHSVGTWPLLQFRNLFPTDGRTPWTIDKPDARPLPTHRTTQTQNKRPHKHPYFEWDSRPVSSTKITHGHLKCTVTALSQARAILSGSNRDHGYKTTV
jgi:hypothetical protein